VVDLPRLLWGPLLRRVILPRRAPRSARLYQSIWTADGSPLELGTRRVVTALAARVAGGATVEHAHRYGAPALAAAIAGAARANAGRIVLALLFAHRTASATGGLIAFAKDTARRLGVADRLRVALVAPDDPGYVRALAARLDEARAAAPREPEHLVVSFHGIPKRHDRREGGVYQADCQATTRALLAETRWPPARATLCYQSRFGPEPWLGPGTARVLAGLPGRGVRRITVITPGFLTDGLETLEEIGVAGREIFENAGGEEYTRARAVEDHPGFIDALARAIEATP